MSTSSCECVSRPAGLSNICWTVSVCSLSSENPDTPLHSASLRGWGSDRRFSPRRSVGWSGGFSVDTRADLGSVLPPREVPVWCYSRQKLPSSSFSNCIYLTFCLSLSMFFFSGLAVIVILSPFPSLLPLPPFFLVLWEERVFLRDASRCLD